MTAKEVAVLAAVAAALAVWLFFPKQAGGQAVVIRSGEEVGRYNLNVPIRTPISGANGFSLTLVIENGQAHVEDATCPDLICQHHAPIFRAGETIICLPGQIVIQGEGGERLGADTVSG